MQYKTGTVNIENGSPTVTGINTLWQSAGISAGALFCKLGDGVLYQIGVINSNTQITLSSNYLGTTSTNSQYSISSDFTNNFNIPLIGAGDRNWTKLYNQAMSIIDNKIHTIQNLDSEIYNRGINLLVTGNLQHPQDNICSFIVPFTGILKHVRAEVDTAPAGDSFQLDILVNGTSILAEYITIADGALQSEVIFLNNAVSRYSTVSLDIKQLGSTTAGGNSLRLILYFQNSLDEPDGGLAEITTADSPYTAEIENNNIWVDSSAGNVTVILPNANLWTATRKTVLKGSGDLNNITISCTEALINGQANHTFSDAYGAVTFLSNGTQLNMV